MFCESYLLLFVKVTQASKAPACQRHNLKLIRAKVDHVIDCVFLPAHVIPRAGIHTVCAWSAWEWSTQSWLLRGPAFRIVSGYHRVHFAPGGFSSRREPSPAFLALLAPPPLRRSGGCIRGVRSWIWQREWRRAAPIFVLSCQIHCPFSGIGSPFCVFFPSESGLSASPIFLRGGRCGDHWLFAHSIPPIWGVIRGSHSRGRQVEHRLAHEESDRTAEKEIRWMLSA